MSKTIDIQNMLSEINSDADMATDLVLTMSKIGLSLMTAICQ